VAEAFLGEIRLFPYNFAPQGWAFCNGQIMAIAQNTALFSLLGTTYGGNGTSNFALPDLRGRLAVSSGQAPGLSPYTLGQQSGTESVPITVNNLPSHNHTVSPAANNGAATEARPAGAVMARGTASIYAAAADGTTTMAGSATSSTGNSQPVSSIQPLLVLNYCIALQGIFPSRN
jgi:microcystin-dependent protein